MGTSSSAIGKIFSCCDVCINGYPVSKEQLMLSFSAFLDKTIDKNEHNVNIVLHTGSKCFDAVILAYAALSNILYNETDTETIVHSLVSGDIVLYNKKRYIFKGFVNAVNANWGLENAEILENGNYILLAQDSSWTAIPKPFWSKIVPYKGKSNRLDGRGLKRDNGNRKSFFKDVLGMKDEEIPSTIDTSTIIVMPRDSADEIIRGISFRFNDQEIQFTELVTASYYTENDQEYPYGGNAAKVEPVIKITSKISVARKLLLKRDWNRNIGLIILGDESIQKGQMELPELIDRKSIQYIYLCTNVDSDSCNVYLSNSQSINLFACTKEFLLSTVTRIQSENPYTIQLSKQVDAIIDHEIEEMIVNGGLSWEKYVAFKRSLYSIKMSDYESEEKNDFVIQAFSLMNLFITAVFSIEVLENAVSNKVVTNIISPDVRMMDLEKTAQLFPDYLKQQAIEALSILTDAYISVYGGSEKEKRLNELIESNRDKKICIVVPKAYYTILMTTRLSKYKNVNIVTAMKFDNTKLFDIVICIGLITGRRFNMFRCKSATRLIVLLYENEMRQYHRAEKRAEQLEHDLNKRSTIVIPDYYEEVAAEDESIIEEIDIIDAQINELSISSIAGTARYYSGNSNKGSTADIVAIARFDSGETAFFTKNYKAYVLDPLEQTVRDVGVDEITDGDTIIFTRSNAKTRDIVDNILQEMVSTDQVPKEIIDSYEKSKTWREKLVNYMIDQDLTVTSIAKTMIKNGVAVQEATVKRWLDEDAHIVGPRDLSSIQQIALLINDGVMFDQAELYLLACSEIRAVRKKILDAIAKATLTKLAGQQLKKDSILATVNEQIIDQAVVLQVDNIVFVDDAVPVNMINRPVSVGID